MDKATCKFDGCANDGRLRRGLCGKHYQWVTKHGKLADYDRKLIHTDATLDERLRHHGWTVTESGCWEWKASRNGNNYGQLATGGTRPMLATRAAYTAWIGDLPEGAVVCHACDNPPCINPAHLFAGTHQDNADDMARKRRSANGERSGVHKLPDANVDEIRGLYSSGAYLQRELAEAFGVTQSAVSMIVNRRRRGRETNPPLPKTVRLSA
ncbi:HNH endonuclease [Pseudarthrobacter sp. NIBRBAC000502771]|uniref:HNH endonuclease n=1 Tax=Pseudarthrobacter sp. NIBRBAC000502771 TaxID=2590774 RepID=UPI00113062F9|nr:HNH endonuclease [Pseudarthrobacter sp. NIBRBAC000502771]QDG61200.1 hypothetical protein NIBR502771_02020 [Pseudarthrobacter sp. NIBRBAC000502771]